MDLIPWIIPSINDPKWDSRHSALVLVEASATRKARNVLQIKHQIRTGCSKLKAHLHFNLHVEDDPSCRCGFGIEDPYHFLFTCPLYAQIRVVMPNY